MWKKLIVIFKNCIWFRKMPYHLFPRIQKISTQGKFHMLLRNKVFQEKQKVSNIVKAELQLVLNVFPVHCSGVPNVPQVHPASHQSRQNVSKLLLWTNIADTPVDKHIQGARILMCVSGSTCIYPRPQSPLPVPDRKYENGPCLLIFHWNLLSVCVCVCVSMNSSRNLAKLVSNTLDVSVKSLENTFRLKTCEQVEKFKLATLANALLWTESHFRNYKAYSVLMNMV